MPRLFYDILRHNNAGKHQELNVCKTQIVLVFIFPTWIHGTGCFRIPDLGADSCPGNGANFVPFGTKTWKFVHFHWLISATRPLAVHNNVIYSCRNCFALFCPYLYKWETVNPECLKPFLFILIKITQFHPRNIPYPMLLQAKMNFSFEKKNPKTPNPLYRYIEMQSQY